MPLDILHDKQVSVRIRAYSVRQLCCDSNVSSNKFSSPTIRFPGSQILEVDENAGEEEEVGNYTIRAERHCYRVKHGALLNRVKGVVNNV